MITNFYYYEMILIRFRVVDINICNIFFFFAAAVVPFCYIRNQTKLFDGGHKSVGC